MSPVTITVDRTSEALRELGSDLAAARDRGGRWFGRYSMLPLSVTDRELQELRLAGLVEVIEWDDGPADGHLRYARNRAVRTRSRPRYVRLSTDGWALFDR